MTTASGRKGGLRDLTFVTPDGVETPISGVVWIKSWLGPGGKGRSLLNTLDIDAARKLCPGMTGRLVARWQGLHADAPEPDPTVLGYYRIDGPPLYSGGHKEMASAKVRLVEDPAGRPTPEGPLLEMSIVVEDEPGGAAPADYRSYFFDDSGRPKSD